MGDVDVDGRWLAAGCEAVVSRTMMTPVSTAGLLYC